MKPKRWSELTAFTLAAATREFDDPAFNPPARKPPRGNWPTFAVPSGRQPRTASA